MQILNKGSYIDLMGKRKLAVIFSGVLLLIALGAIIVRGLNLGIDFTGGTLVEVKYPQAVELAAVREALNSDGFSDAVVQHFGTSREVLVRLAPREDVESAELSDRAFKAMQSVDSNADLR
ncbi:MAG: protein translocase subunit SecF, partial [Candidatus Thiodiazotropha sp. 6PLUC4]